MTTQHAPDATLVPPTRTLIGSDPLLTTDQAAAELAIPARTLQSWRSKGRYSGPPYVRLSNHVRYRRSDLNAWVTERVVGGRA